MQKLAECRGGARLFTPSQQHTFEGLSWRREAASRMPHSQGREAPGAPDKEVASSRPPDVRGASEQRGSPVPSVTWALKSHLPFLPPVCQLEKVPLACSPGIPFPPRGAPSPFVVCSQCSQPGLLVVTCSRAGPGRDHCDWKSSRDGCGVSLPLLPHWSPSSAQPSFTLPLLAVTIIQKPSVNH